jgi:nucleobase:cation symporter-1, NCS1 family
MTMGWLGVNTWIVLDLVLGIFQEMGYENPGTGTKYAVGIGIMGVQAVIAVVGFYWIQTFEKWTVPVAAAVMGLMTILAFREVDVVWNTSTVGGGDKWTSITQLMTAIGIGWGITWLSWSSDYTRFIKPGTPERKVFLSTFAGIFVPTVWLGFVGAAIASAGTEADPAALVTAAFGGVSILILFLVMHGPVATNILNLYSATLAALSLDVKAARWKVALVVSAVGTITLIAFIQSDSFAHDFDNWLVSVVVWIAAWGGVMLVDYYVVRRGKIDVAGLYDDPATARYGDINWAAVIAALAGLVAGWSWEYGLVDFFQGPLAKATNNTDLSWLAAFVVSGGLYYVLRPILAKEERPSAAPTPAR